MAETELSREAASKGRPDWRGETELSSCDTTEFRCCNWDCLRVTEGDNNRHIPTSNVLLDFTFLCFVEKGVYSDIIDGKNSFQT